MKQGRIRQFAWTILLLVPVVISFTGCLHNSALFGPNTPKALTAVRARDSYILNEIQNYLMGKCLQANNPLPGITVAADSISSLTTVTSINCGQSRQTRDIIVYDLKLVIDLNYSDYARHFQETSDTTNVIGEIGSASLSAVSTLVGAGEIKDILATASSLTTATNVSFQKNYFQKQTGYAILAAMNAARLKQWSQIADALKKNDIDTYSLSAALSDLLEYKRVGSATAALTIMQEQSSVQGDAAKGEIQKTMQAKPTSRQ